MKLFLELQWQESRFVYLFLLALFCIAPFILSYDKVSEMQLLIIAYVLIISNSATPARIIASRDTFEYIRSLPVSSRTISKYFIYTQLFFTVTLFVLTAPHHFYAAYVQQQWTLFILSYCSTFWVCLIIHLVLLPSKMRKMKEDSVLETVAVTVPAFVFCYLTAFVILHFFPNSASIIFIVMTILLIIFYMKRIQKYMDIRIYENVNI